MIRAMLDTNVLVSGFAGLTLATSTPGAIMRHWLEGTFELVISASIQTELERTFTKPYFRSRRSIAQIIATERLVANSSAIVVPTIVVSGVASHPEDDLVIAAAVSAGVDYLVTGDKQLQRLGVYQGISILSPREFLVLIGVSGGEEA